MATELERLVVRIEADAAQLRKEFRGVERETTKMRRTFSGLGPVVARAILPLTAAFTTAGLVRGIGNAVTELARLGDTADKLGIAAETLQELRFAGEEVGVATQTTDLAMQRFIRRLGEAANGSGELKGTLDRYNISVRDAQGNTRDAVDVLKDLADATRSAKSNQEQLAIAFKAFDSEGAALVSVLRQGGEGIERFRERARELGIVIREDLVKEAQEVRREFDRLVTFLTTKFMAGVISTIAGLRSAFAQDFVLPDNIKDANDQLSQTRDRIQEIQQQMEGGGQTDIFGMGGAALPEELNLLERREQALERQIALLQLMSDIPPPEALGGAAGGATAEDRRQQRIDRLLESLAREEKQLGFLLEAHKQNERAVENVTDAIEIENLAVENSVEAGSEEEMIITQRVVAINELKRAIDELRKSQEQSTRETEKSATKQAELTETQKRVVSGAQELGLTFTSAFEDAVVEGEKLSDILKALEKDILRLLIRKTITEPLFDFLGTAVTAGIGGAEGGLVRGPGTGTSDSIPARLSAGEFVINARQTAKHLDLLEAINSNTIPGFQRGGMVPRLVSPASTVTSSMDRSVTINSLNIVARDADDVRRNLSRRQIARILSNQAQAGVS